MKTLNLEQMKIEEQNSNEAEKPLLNIGAVISRFSLRINLEI